MNASNSLTYTQTYFERGQAGSARSAFKIVPELIRLISPNSVVDVGCGIGTWARAFQICGIDDVLGIDGPYIPMDLLHINRERFLVADLSQRLNVGRTFDLALTVEVAEHLPASRAETFVSDLVRLATVVAFSAAIPGQGGQNHINEQWPDYWEAYFARFNYVAVDCLRSQFWDDEEVEFWYRQNLVLFVSKDRLGSFAGLSLDNCRPKLMRLVHPKLYLRNLSFLVNALKSFNLRERQLPNSGTVKE